MESWGCEFLELEQTSDYQQLKPKIHFLPIHVIDKMVNQEEKQKILTYDMDYVQHLRYLINKDGLQYPGVLLLGTNGILLHDGNHRFLAMRDTYSLFPVITKISNNPIKIKCGSYRDILPYILEIL